MADTAPPGIDLYADQGGRLVASMIALIVLPTLFVIARLISRRASHAGYWYDDLWVTIACVLCYVQCICVLVSERHNGFGRHIYILNDPTDNTREFVKILYVYEIGYYSSTAAVKIAILAFYRRIFPVQQLKFLLYIAIGVVSVYFVGSILTVIFQCSPIHRFWDLTQPGHCSNGDLVQIVPGAFNCVIDFFIILLPLPLLWRLRTTVSQKGVLTGIFVCAGFVCIISIIRLVILSRLDAYDVTWNYVNSAIWSAAEPCMGVISACIPSLRPLVSILLRGTTRAIGGTKIGGKSSAQDASRGSSRTWRSRCDANQFSRRDEPTETRGQWGHDVTVHGGKTGVVAGSDISLAEMNVPAGGIRVKDEVVVTSSGWIPYRHDVY